MRRRRAAAPARRSDQGRRAARGPAWCSRGWRSPRPGCACAASRRSRRAAGTPRDPADPDCGPRVTPPPSLTSPISDWASRVTSLAILPSAAATRASAAPRSMIRSRSVCQGSTGSARPSSSASSATTRGPSSPSERERARRAAELHGQPPRADRGQPLAGLVHAGQPARRDQAEGDGNGLLEQRAADHDRGPVRLGQPGRGLGRLGQVGQHDVDGPLGQQHRGRVHDVLAGRAAVHGARPRSAGTRRASARASPGTGFPVSAASSPSSSGSKLPAWAAAVTASPEPAGASPARSSARASPASASSIACSHAVSPASTPPRAKTPPNSPRAFGSSWSGMSEISPLPYPAHHHRPTRRPIARHRGYSYLCYSRSA